MKRKVASLLVLFSTIFLFPLTADQTKYRVVKLFNTGWIKGRVTHSQVNLDIPKLEVNRDASICGSEPRVIQAVDLSPEGGLRNAVVYLKDISAGKDFTLSAEPPVLRQSHCNFEPHLQIVPPMSSIKITNEDKILHGVHAFQFPLDTKFVLYPHSVTYPARTLFNIAMVAQRTESFQQLGAPGIVKFICEAGHYWMTAYAVVAPHPYYVKVGSDGAFEMTDVPPGKYILVSWHELFGTKEQKIEVKENQPAVVNFTYSEAL